MIKKQPQRWRTYLGKMFRKVTSGYPTHFSNLKPSDIPEVGGIYLITCKKGTTEIPYYVGRSMNLRRRIYTNHLMGPPSNARLKKYLINAQECKNAFDAKEFIRKKCLVRWLPEDDTRKRGAVEGYLVGILFPKYGICEEH